MERLLEWTGERCVPWSDDFQMIYEHYHRYLFASRLVAGKRVLDLASGEGYGADLLARAGAAAVVGIELDETAVAHAQARYPVVEFRRGSMLDPEAVEESGYDVVTCFEALEHIEDHGALMAVARRALRPDGLLVVSTPDTEVYSGLLGQDNPFHVHELDRDGFAAWLRGGFAHHRMWHQSTVVGSVLAPGPTEAAAAATLAVDGLQRITTEDWVVVPPAPAPYIVAVAGDGPLPDLGASLLADVDLGAVREAQRESHRLADELREARAALRQSTGWQENVAALRDQLRDCTVATERAASERDALAAELAELRRWRQEVEASRAWLLVQVLRGARRVVRRRR